MPSRRTPVHPILPPGVLSSTDVAASSSAIPTTSRKRKADESPAIVVGELKDVWQFHSTTYNRWNPMSTHHKYVVRYSRESIIADPFRINDLPNYNGAKGVERKFAPNKSGK